MRILGTMKKFPAGAMVIPLLAGAIINTFAPNILQIGGFTTAIFSNAALPTLIGLFFFASGAQIDAKQAGGTVYRGFILLILKFVIGYLFGLLIHFVFGEYSLFGLTSLAVISAMTNSNGVIFATLASEFGDEEDLGIVSVIAINDAPTLTMVALGSTGIGTFPIMDIIAGILPMILGFIVGNIDREWKNELAPAVTLLPPFNGFAIGAGMNLGNIVKSGMGGILLGLMTVLFTGLGIFVIYSLIRRKADPMGAALGTSAGVAAMTPVAVAESDPSFLPQVESAQAQIATSTVLTAILTPLLTSFLFKWSDKYNRKHKLGKYKDLNDNNSVKES